MKPEKLTSPSAKYPKDYSYQLSDWLNIEYVDSRREWDIETSGWGERATTRISNEEMNEMLEFVAYVRAKQ